jgi:hypothetical protein
VGVGECGCVWFGLDQHHDDEPGRARTSLDGSIAEHGCWPLVLVHVFCSCSARACALVRERVPVAERVRAYLLNLRCIPSASNLASLSSHLAPRSPHLAPRISQLSSRTSHLSALISHLALPQVACQIFRRRRRRGPMRGTQHRDCLCTTVVECPSPPPSTVWPCAVPARVLGWTCGRVGVWSCGRHRARRRYQVSCSTRWVPRCRPDGARRCLSGRV